LRSARFLTHAVEDKPKRDQSTEKPKNVDPDLLRVWNDILRTAFVQLAQQVVSWETLYLKEHKLNMEVGYAETAIRALIKIYSDEYVPNYFALDSTKRQLALLSVLHRSLDSSNMLPAERHLEVALNAHPNQQIARNIDRDQLKNAFLDQVRHGIIHVALGKVDKAYRTNLATQLILDPMEKSKQEPKIRSFLNRS